MLAERLSPALFEVNGVRVLHLENSSFLINIQILTNVGSAAEGPQEYGLAHILEHMFFKGSRKRPGGSTISRAANDIGGKLNAYTTYDHTAYYITVLNDSFEEGFDILADMYQHPLFPEEEFARELNPILSELREQEDSPESFLSERCMQDYFGSAYHPVIGTAQTIRGATVSMMHGFRSRYYGRENTMIVVVGGIEERRVRQVIEEHYLDEGEVETPAPIAARWQAGEARLTKAGIQEAYYELLFPALPSSHPDRYKQDVMNYILGGNESALLFERIRDELGLSCYGVYSWTLRNPPFACLGISCGIAPDEIDQLHNEVLGQIDRIASSSVGQDRLDRARASLRTSIASRAETSAGMGGMIGLPALRGESNNAVEKALAAIEAITLDDVLDQAQKTFQGPRFLGVLTPA